MTWPGTTGCCSVTSPSRIYLPAASHGAKVIAIQSGLSAGSIWCQTYQNTTCTFSATILRDSSIQRLPSSLLFVNQRTEKKNIFSSVQRTSSKTVITLQLFHPKHMEISFQLCHLKGISNRPFHQKPMAPLAYKYKLLSSTIWTHIVACTRYHRPICMYVYKLLSLVICSLVSLSHLMQILLSVVKTISWGICPSVQCVPSGSSMQSQVKRRVDAQNSVCESSGRLRFL